MPKATVATTTRSSPARNAACTAERSAASSLAWYAAANFGRVEIAEGGLPPLSSASRLAATSSACRVVSTYTIVGPARRATAATSATAAEAGFGARSHENNRFGRSNDVRHVLVRPGRIFSSFISSFCTRGVAVAVSAITGTPGRASRSSPSLANSGRKSCPHSETQCASSTASRDTPRP